MALVNVKKYADGTIEELSIIDVGKDGVWNVNAIPKDELDTITQTLMILKDFHIYISITPKS